MTFNGHYGQYGGRFVAETLMAPLIALEEAANSVLPEPAFQKELSHLLSTYVGRPTPLSSADRFARRVDAQGKLIRHLLLKREDLCHTGAHKINNALGQVLLAKRMGKTRVIAETGAGQHGVATATACALLGMPCEVYQGALDVERQSPNVARMEMLGAKVIPVHSGSKTLKDAMNEALRDWVTYVDNTYYCVGSAAGPHPYPMIVSRLQRIIGDEAKAQCDAAGIHVDAAIACVGGGSNAIGLFQAFMEDSHTSLYGVEAAGDGIDTARHAATLNRGVAGVLHGSYSYVLCDAFGQIVEPHSISAGLDYPGVGPEHAALKDSKRVTYLAATDREALHAVTEMARSEGILIALETAHAVAKIHDIASRESACRGRPVDLVVCLSGRGDKDLQTLMKHLRGNG